MNALYFFNYYFYYSPIILPKLDYAVERVAPICGWLKRAIRGDKHLKSNSYPSDKVKNIHIYKYLFKALSKIQNKYKVFTTGKSRTSKSDVKKDENSANYYMLVTIVGIYKSK